MGKEVVSSGDINLFREAVGSWDQWKTGGYLRLIRLSSDSESMTLLSNRISLLAATNENNPYPFMAINEGQIEIEILSKDTYRVGIREIFPLEEVPMIFFTVDQGRVDDFQVMTVLDRGNSREIKPLKIVTDNIPVEGIVEDWIATGLSEKKIIIQNARDHKGYHSLEVHQTDQGVWFSFGEKDFDDRILIDTSLLTDQQLTNRDGKPFSLSELVYGIMRSDLDKEGFHLASKMILDAAEQLLSFVN